MTKRILLDECLPKKLKYRIEELDPNFLAFTVPEVGWASVADGELLEKSQKEFDVLLTTDRNLSFQQSIEVTDIHVVLLKAPTNTYEDLLSLVERLKPVFREPGKGLFTEIE